MNQDVKDAVAALRGMPYEEYREVLASLLQEIDTRQRYGSKLFEALLRVMPSVAFEAVALRMSANSLEIYLAQRADDDIAYPGQWHAPGSIQRTHERPRDTADRLAHEFGTSIRSFAEVDDYFPNEDAGSEHRGSIMSTVYLVELNGDPHVDERHRWFPVDALPEPMVDVHRDSMIPMAVLAFVADKRLPFQVSAKLTVTKKEEKKK